MKRLRARLLTPRDEGTVDLYPDALVEIDGSEITSVGPYAGGPVDEDLRPHLLVPGFVDGHVHYPQTRIVGQATGPLLQWLARSTFPEEARFADPSHARAIAEIFCSKLAAAGTTTALVYGPVFSSAVRTLLEVASARGQPLVTGPVLMDAHSPPELTIPADRALGELSELADDWHGRSGFQIAVIPRFALSCTHEMMSRAADLAARRSLRISTHLSENPEECRIAAERFGAPDYLSVYERAGLLQPGAVFAHCIHLSEGEWDKMARASAIVAHCPDSNDFLGSGGMRTDALLARSVPMVLGTDIAAGRSFRVSRAASHAYDNALRRGISASAEQIWWWATAGAARALGVRAGILASGYRADFALFEPPAWASSAQELLASLLFDADAPAMHKTWVGGRLVHG